MDRLIPLGFAGMVLITGLTLVFLGYRDWQLVKTAPDEQNRMPFSAKFLLIVLGGMVFVWMVNSIFSSTASGTGFATVAGLILLGVAAVIGIMNLLSVSASRIGIIDGRQPFGLPEGSVRAILTMAFIVLVGVLSAFLLTGNRDRTDYSVEGQVVAAGLSPEAANARVEELTKTYGVAALVSMTAEKAETPADGKTKAPPPAGGAGDPPPNVPGPVSPAASPANTYSVAVHSRVDHTVSDDIAKQTLTMISTILAAMIGFYFASRGNADSVDPAIAQREKARQDLGAAVSDLQIDGELASQKASLEKLKEAIAKNGDANQRRAMAEMLKAPEASLRQFETQVTQAKALAASKDAAFTDIEASKTLIAGLKDKAAQLTATLATLKQQIDP
jgi:hypothetical protein